MSVELSNCFKGALSSLRQILANESSLKVMKNAFYFTSKACLVFEIFNFFVLNFQTCRKAALFDVTTWLANNCSAHTDQYLKK